MLFQIISLGKHIFAAKIAVKIQKQILQYYINNT